MKVMTLDGTYCFERDKVLTLLELVRRVGELHITDNEKTKK